MAVVVLVFVLPEKIHNLGVGAVEKVCKLDASCGGKLARCMLASGTRGGA